jgi:SagB-type dehydrogenase family enzyme
VRPHELRYRRYDPLVMYWQGGELVFENYAVRKQVSAAPATCSILDFCGEWRTFQEIASFLGNYSESSVLRNLRELCANGLLQRSDIKADQRIGATKRWAGWNPAAGFFHFSTKDADFAPDPTEAIRRLQQRAKYQPMPQPLKEYRAARRFRLPQVAAHGDFPNVLRERRTWRVFGRESVSLEHMAQTLQLTFGIQGWVEVPGLGRAAMKTSPSGGALHPIEAYVLVQRVAGLPPGIYHYRAEGHELECIGAGIGRRVLQRNLGNQWWFARGAFLVLMTAVVGRMQWKYDYARAYRVLLAEAGHLGQTFCLTATWLGLAPFCTMAYMDTKWEEWLGIDGVMETMVYVLGAGTRPKPEQMRDAHIGLIGKDKAPTARRR